MDFKFNKTDIKLSFNSKNIQYNDLLTKEESSNKPNIEFNKEKDKFLFMNSILLFISLCISNKKNINISNLELDILNKENISYDDIKLLFIKNYFILCEGKCKIVGEVLSN